MFSPTDSPAALTAPLGEGASHSLPGTPDAAPDEPASPFRLEDFLPAVDPSAGREVSRAPGRPASAARASAAQSASVDLLARELDAFRGLKSLRMIFWDLL